MSFPADDYKKFQVGSQELINKLVEDHLGWASSIARSVARAWNMDWQLDGLDGGAYEGLLFCAGRYDPSLGIPFRAYARKRIHEASTEEARKSKSWQKAVGADTPEEQAAREISFRLFHIYPELREGLLPKSEGEGEDAIRSSVRELLASASVLASFQEDSPDNPEVAMQYKQILEIIAELEPVHQEIIWNIYWEGNSMRSLADGWKIDELAVIREHKEIINFVSSRLMNTLGRSRKKLKIRPGLRQIAHSLRRKRSAPPFERFSADVAALLIFSAIVSGALSAFKNLVA